MSQLLCISCFHLKEAQNKLKTSQTYSSYIQLWMHRESPKPPSLCVKWSICTNIPAGQIVSVLHKEVVGSKVCYVPLCGAVQGFGAPAPDLCNTSDTDLSLYDGSLWVWKVSADKHLLHVSSYPWKYCWTWTAQIKRLIYMLMGRNHWDSELRRTELLSQQRWASCARHHRESLLNHQLKAFMLSVVLYFWTETLFPTVILLSRGAQSVQQKFV